MSLVVVFLPLGNSPSSEFYVPRFRNTLSVALHRSCPHYLWRWNRLFQKVCTWNSYRGESPKRNNTTFITGQNFGIKNFLSFPTSEHQEGKRVTMLFLCFLVRASSYIPISRPTDATCDRFLFSIYMCITLHVSNVNRSSSGVPHRTYSLQFLCLCLSAALSCKKLFTRQCRRQKQTEKLEAVCTVRDSWWWALDARNM
jgi:hypothetical protein